VSKQELVHNSKSSKVVETHLNQPNFLIELGNNARNALIKLGLGDDFDKLSTQIPSSIWFEWRRGEGNDQKLIATVRPY